MYISQKQKYIYLYFMMNAFDLKQKYTRVYRESCKTWQLF